MQTIFLIGLLLSVAACSLAPQRTYLSEMEEDDASFFQPREDFPVVPGDTGRAWRTKKDWARRTPVSETTRLRQRENVSLEEDLARLEGEQSEGAARHYQQYRARLATTSERIYFLQLKSKAQREEYLRSRGFVSQENVMPIEAHWAQQQGELLLGMSKDDVKESWGRPERVDVAGNPNYENERWSYRRDGAVKYIFFESGRVGGWSSTAR